MEYLYMEIFPCCSSSQCALESSVTAMNLSENFGGVATNKTCPILTSEFLFYILISDQIADFCHFDQETLQFTLRSYNFMHICQKSGSFAIRSSEISELWQHCALKSGSLAIKRF